MVRRADCAHSRTRRNVESAIDDVLMSKSIAGRVTGQIDGDFVAFLIGMSIASNTGSHL
jgi:hypothetical protein